MGDQISASQNRTSAAPQVAMVVQLDPLDLTDESRRRMVRIQKQANGATERLRLPYPYPVTLHQDRPFILTRHLHRLCSDVCRRTPALAHVDMDCVLVTVIPTRSRRRTGLQARIVTLFFDGGNDEEIRETWRFRIQRHRVGATDMRYVLSFCVPRFLEQPFDEKMVTIFHEMFHISEEFDGSLRHFDGADEHAGDIAAYDRHMAYLARDYIGQRPDPVLYDFLKLPFEDLERRVGPILGLRIPAPKILRIARA